MTQLTRMELQSKEDRQHIEINYKSKVEDLETRVQNLEWAAQHQMQGSNQMPADQMPADQIPESRQMPCNHDNVIARMVNSCMLKHRATTNYIKKSNISAHLADIRQQHADIQQQHDTNCAKRDEAQTRTLKRLKQRLIESTYFHSATHLDSAMRMESGSMIQQHTPTWIQQWQGRGCIAEKGNHYRKEELSQQRRKSRETKTRQEQRNPDGEKPITRNHHGEPITGTIINKRIKTTKDRKIRLRTKEIRIERKPIPGNQHHHKGTITDLQRGIMDI